jgi:hypothetical protein
MSSNDSSSYDTLDYIIMFTNFVLFALYAFLDTPTWAIIIVVYLGICVLNDLADLVLYD